MPDDERIDYRCKCGAAGVKLWRQYNTFLDHIELHCVDCGLKRAQKLRKFGYSKELICTEVAADGSHLFYGSKNYELNSLVPAVPTAELDTFWGYTSTPQDRWQWWLALPLRQDPKLADQETQ
jgi:hypothetical protein